MHVGVGSDMEVSAGQEFIAETMAAINGVCSSLGG